MPDVFIATERKVLPAPQKPTTQKDLGSKDIVSKPYNPPKDKQLHIFTAFHRNPEGMHFINQEKDEKILLFLRSAFLTNLRWIVISVIFMVLPLLLLPFINLSKPVLFFPIRYVFFFTSFYYLIIFSYIYVSFITWYFNISLVTNIRILDVDFSNLIYKNVAATKLNLVQDVSFTQVGTLRTLFDYGDVHVQTAGTFENFEFLAVPQPENAVHIIEDLIGKDDGL